MLFENIAGSGEKIPIPEAAITALLGYAVVFMGLISLMIVVMIVGKVMSAPKKAAAPKAKAVKQNALADQPAAAPAPAPAVSAAAPGSAGQVKLYDTPDREAAMIMAIVANKLNKPLNELRFISIKEVK